MTPEHTKRMRDVIKDLDRDGLFKLAGQLRTSRFAVEDFGMIGTPLPAETMAALEQWLVTWDLRFLMGRPGFGPALANMAERTGIPDEARDAFANGNDATLTAEQQATAFDFLVGKRPPAGPATALGHSAVMPPDIALRGQAMSIVRAMTPEALAEFVQAYRPAEPVAA